MLESEAIAIRGHRYPEMNNTFIKRTAGEWMGRIHIFSHIYNYLSSNGALLVPAGEPLTIAEHGPGTGDISALHVREAKAFHNGPVEFHASDIRPDHVEWTKKRVKAVGAKAVVSLGDSLKVPAEDIQQVLQLPQGKADIAVTEHTLYFTAGDPERAKSVISNIVSELPPNRLLLITLTDESDLDDLRLLYADRHTEESNKTKPAKVIGDAMQSAGLAVNGVDYKTNLLMPHITDDDWQKISDGTYTFDNYNDGTHAPDSAENRRVRDMIHLIEFFGNSLEYLDAIGQREKYVAQVRHKTEESEGKINMGSVVLVTASPGSDPGFVENVREAAEYAKTQLAINGKPLPVIRPSEARHLRILPDLGMEKS